MRQSKSQSQASAVTLSSLSTSATWMQYPVTSGRKRSPQLSDTSTRLPAFCGDCGPPLASVCSHSPPGTGLMLQHKAVMSKKAVLVIASKQCCHWIALSLGPGSCPYAWAVAPYNDLLSTSRLLQDSAIPLT